MSKLSIIIPVFCEENTVLKVLTNLQNLILINGIKKEIVIIDDGSSDNSKKIIEKYMNENPSLDIKFIINKENRGKGFSIQEGIRLATGSYLTIQDADLEYNPEDFNKMLPLLEKNNADVVYGSRFISSNPHRILFFWHYIGNQFLTTISNIFTNLNLTDMETCYKMFTMKVIKSLVLKEERFGFEPEITAKIAKIEKIKIYEVGISYYGRTYEEGKKINWQDGLKALICIIKYNLF